MSHLEFQIAGDPSTPGDVLAGLAMSTDVAMQRALACNPSTPHDVLQRLWEKHPDCVLENPILALWEFTGADSLPEMIGGKALFLLYNHLRRKGDPLPVHIFPPGSLVKIVREGLLSLDSSVFEFLPYEADSAVRLRMVEYPANFRLFEIYQCHAPDCIWEHFANDPDPEVRVQFAILLRSGSQGKVPQRLEIFSTAARLLARDERHEIHIHLAHCRYLPVDLIEKLSCSPDARIRGALSRCLFAPLDVQKKLATDPEEAVRLTMGKNSSSSDIHDILAGDSSVNVRRTLAENSNLSCETLRKFNLRDHPEVTRALFKNPKADNEFRIEILGVAAPEVHEVLLEMGKSLRPKFYRRIRSLICADILAKLGKVAGLHRDIVEDLARDPRPEVRLGVARRLCNSHNNASHAKNVALVNAFACDPDARVREQVCTDWRLQKNATAVLFADPDPRVRKKALRSVLDQLVSSRDARNFARYREIYRQKGSLIVRLARDPDHLIRDLIANCPEAPPAAMNILFNDPEAFIKESVRYHSRWPYGAMLDLVKKVKTNTESLFHGKTRPSTRALRLLADSPNPFIRTLVARCQRTPVAELRKLANDKNPAVRDVARQRL